MATSLLILLALVFGGWLLSLGLPGAARLLAGKLFFLLLLIHGAALISGGLLPVYPSMLAIHRSAAVALQIGGWMMLPMLVGALWRRNLRSRPLVASLQTLLLLGIMLLTVLCSLTGYLNPEPGEGFGAETRTRFVVLHQTVLPTLLTLAMLLACWLLRTQRERPAAVPGHPATTDPPAEESESPEHAANPYRTPRAVD